MLPFWTVGKVMLPRTIKFNPKDPEKGSFLEKIWFLWRKRYKYCHKCKATDFSGFVAFQGGILSFMSHNFHKFADDFVYCFK